MTGTTKSRIYLYKEEEEEQVREEFTKEKNLTEGGRKNWREKYLRRFRTRLIHSNLIFFKEDLLILM